MCWSCWLVHLYVAGAAVLLPWLSVLLLSGLLSVLLLCGLLLLSRRRRRRRRRVAVLKLLLQLLLWLLLGLLWCLGDPLVLLLSWRPSR